MDGKRTDAASVQIHLSSAIKDVFFQDSKISLTIGRLKTFTEGSLSLTSSRVRVVADPQWDRP